MNKKEIENILWGLGVNTFNRFETFLEIAPQLHGENYWYGLKISYTGSDNLLQYKDAIKSSFESNEPNRNSLMSSKELKYINRLPEGITIYRGMTENELIGGQFGVSWTLKKKVAAFFAETYSRNYSTYHLKKVVHKITIKKNKIIAFFNVRQEFEIIYI